MSTFTAIPPTSPETLARGRRLATLGHILLAVGAAAFWFNSPWESMLLNLLAISICIMGVWPMLRWLQRNDLAYPLLEVMQLTMVPFYAVPLLTEHEAVAQYSESVLIQASWLVLLFQIACFLGGVAANQRPTGQRTGAWWMEEYVAESNLKFTGFTLMLTTVWLAINGMTRLVPAEYVGTLRAVFFGIGIISGFIQARLWGQDLLNQSQKMNFIINIFLQMILSSLGLLLITSLITLLLVLVGYFSTARRVPWALCAVALLVFGVLHNGKHKMREIYWDNQTPPPTVTEIPAYYQEWFGYGWEAGLRLKDKDDKTRRSSLLERASLLQIVCYVMDTVPSRSPYLDGKTYGLIPAQIFPRFIWPNKPSPNDSVKMLSVGLGMLSAEQAETTSIGFGLLAEAFANFGYYGDIALAFVLGWLLRSVARATADCSTLSAGGIFRILCLAWCLNAETTLAVWLSSLYQACIAIFLPLILYRSFAKD